MKKVILISGTNRSGSSLLDLMISNSEFGFSTGELYYLFRPRKSFYIMKNRADMYDSKIINFWNDIKNGGEKNVYNNLFHSLKNVEFIVDSSKNPIWIRNQIKYGKNKSYELIPIITYKTPLEFAYSLFKRNQSKYWKRQWINQHLILFYILENFITVKYSMLAINPPNHLELICKKIGIDYFKGKEDYWNSNSIKYFLFGSDTLRKSMKHVYYDNQYDKSYLDFVKNKINTTDKIFDDILEILDAYEVGLKGEIDSLILKKKEKIRNFNILNQLKFELETSKYGEINNFIDNFKNNADRLLRKINNTDK